MLNFIPDDYVAYSHWILGDSFMRQYMMIHDKTNKQIGFVMGDGTYR